MGKSKKKDEVVKEKKRPQAKHSHGTFNLSRSAKIMCLTSKEKNPANYRALVRIFGEAEENYRLGGRLALKG